MFPQAWREGNEGVAEFMMQKITGAPEVYLPADCGCTQQVLDNDQRLAHLPPADVRNPLRLSNADHLTCFEARIGRRKIARDRQEHFAT